MKFGYICIVGPANAGKSTLVNALVGEKVSIVSYRPQTTRNKVIGIINRPEYQIAGTNGLQEQDKTFIGNHDNKTPMLVCVNKIDSITKETLFKILEQLNQYQNVNGVVPISAKKKENIDRLLELLIPFLNEEEKIYPDDMYTDSSIRFMVTEIIREKALYLLNKELPYGIGVEINTFEYNEKKDMYDINIDIICERKSHKSMIIGKGGLMLKEIATQARKDIEKLVDKKVFLTLYVKIKENWRDNAFMLKELNYNIKDLND